MKNSVFLKEIVFNNKNNYKALFYILSIGIVSIIGIVLYFIDGISILFPVFTQAVTVIVALFGLGGFFTHKEKLMKDYDSTTAYRIAFFRYHVVFIPFVYVAAIHSYFIAQPIITEHVFYNVRYVIGFYLLLTGIILHIKARKLFGLDNLFMYYVYHPNESRMVETVIHSIIRHPIYSAMNRLSWAGAFINGSWVAYCVALLFTCNQVLWLYIYEEPELIQRFGTGYSDFMKKTPALYPRLNRLGDFIQFLIGKKK